MTNPLDLTEIEFKARTQQVDTQQAQFVPFFVPFNLSHHLQNFLWFWYIILLLWWAPLFELHLNALNCKGITLFK